MEENNNQSDTIDSKTVLEQHKLRRYQSRYSDGSDEIPKNAHVVFYSGPYVSTDGEVFHGTHVDGIRFIEDDK